MDQDLYRSFYNTSGKVYYSNRYRYPENPTKNTKVTYCKQQQPKIQNKKQNYPNNQNYPMNQLAPRFQQRALYSQYYRTDYESTWRANLLAASYRDRCNSKNSVLKVINLGERPEPEGAPSFKLEECETPSDYVDYEKILNNDITLYSDYGSESEDLSDQDDVNCVEKEGNTPNSTWSTASLLTHAFNKASSNKVTVMSYAVIGAELNSLTKLHTLKTETDLSRLTKKTLKLTENIDNARKSLKDIALGLRSLKQDMKHKSKRSSSKRDKLLKHSSASHLSDLPFLLENTDKRQNKRKSAGLLDKTTLPHDSSHLTNYYTLDRRYMLKHSNPYHCYSDPKFSTIKYMNLDMDSKLSSSDEY